MAAYNSYGQDERYSGGPHTDPQFDTMNLEPPLRLQQTPRPAVGGEALGAGYAPAAAMTEPQATAPPRPTAALHMEAGGGAHRMSRALLISSLILRVGAILALIVAVAVLASDSYSDPDLGVSASFSDFSAFKYALAAAIIGALYSIYETISIALRLGMGHFFLPGKAPLFVSYIGDQIVIVLLLTGGSAAAATVKDVEDVVACDNYGNFCSQAGGAIAVIFLGFCFLAASLVISSFCLYKNRT